MTLHTGPVHVLDLSDVEFLEDHRIADAVAWRDVLDTFGPHDPLEESVATLPPRSVPSWEEAMDCADTRIWVRPYAAR
jgi:hypothetical protein